MSTPLPSISRLPPDSIERRQNKIFSDVDKNANNEIESGKVTNKTIKDAGQNERKVEENEMDRDKEMKGGKDCICKNKQLPTLWKPPNIRVFPSIREPDLTQETPEQTALRRLRSRLRPYLGHPIYHGAVCLPDPEILAWLRPFDLNVYMAEARLLQYYEARKQMGLDRILLDYKPPEVLKFNYTGGLCGIDRGNRPIWYELLGYLQMKRLVKSVSRADFIKFKYYQLEMLKEEAKKAGVFNILVIVDMRDMMRNSLGYAQDMWIEFIQIVQRHYPYLVKEYVIINRPVVFTEFTLALRPYLNALTMAKVTVLGSDYNKYLLERIEKHHIPACYGGYKCDIDNNPNCRQNLLWDGQVPTWMQVTDKRLAANVHRLSILGGQRLVKETHVATPGSHMFWTFDNLTQPIVFSVYLDRIHPDWCVVKETLVSTSMCDNRVAVYVCKTAGRYLTIMDNCKNYARSVKGFYKINVVLPDWITAKLAIKTPIGDHFDTFKPIGEREAEVLQWKRAQQAQNTWDMPTTSPTTATAIAASHYELFKF